LNRKNVGIFCGAASAVIYGVTPTLVRIAYNQSLTPPMVIVLRATLSLPITAALFFLTHKPGEKLFPDRLTWKRWLPGYGGMAMTTLLLSLSYAYIPVGMATTLHFVYPILVNLGCVWVFRERLSLGKCAALLMASAGILLFMEAGAVSNGLGLVLALLSGGCYAFYMVYLSWSGMDRKNLFCHAFWINVLTALLGMVMGLVNGDLSFHVPGKALMCVWMVSIMDSIFAVILLQLGIRFAGASVTSVLATLEPITSVVMGYLVLHEGMTEQKWLGCVCIIVSVIVIACVELTAVARSE